MSIPKLLYLFSCLFLVLLFVSACKAAQPNSSYVVPTKSSTISPITSPAYPTLSSVYQTTSSAPPISSSLSTTISSTPPTNTPVPPNTSSDPPTTSPAPPAILSANLPVDTAGTWVGLDVLINFSIRMDGNATAKALTISPKITHEISWKNSNATMVIHPLVNWEILTSYEITVTSQAQSATGSRIKQDYSVTFAVKERPEPPKVISTDPVHHETDVMPEAIFRISFSQPMDTKATEQSLVIIPDTDLTQGYMILWDKGNQRLSFYFAQNMRPGEDYFITVTTKAMSAVGVYLEENYTFEFQIMSC